MRPLVYALAGIVLGYGYPILCMYIETGIKKLIELGIYLICLIF